MLKLKHWSCRQLVILIIVVGITIIAFADDLYKPLYFDLAKIALGGYLGQQVPQSFTKGNYYDNRDN